MLKQGMMIAGLAALVLLTGCDPKKDEATPDASQTRQKQAESAATYAEAPTSAGTAASTGGEATTQAPSDAKPASDGKEVTTASGLKYVDVKVGTGASPAVGQTVSVHYTGTLTNGTKFDSSHDHPGDEPLAFPLGTPGIIKGWNEGISTMKVGGKRKLTIPADLAYGAEEKRDGTGAVIIPSNSTLVFDVELVGVK